jgi:hypothetical protein
MQDHRDSSLEVLGMNFDSLGFDGLLLTIAWLITLIWCLRNGKLLAAGFATIGVFVSFVPGPPDWIQLTAILLFVIAIWLEAMLRERIYSRWLGDEKARN